MFCFPDTKLCHRQNDDLGTRRSTQQKQRKYLVWVQQALFVFCVYGEKKNVQLEARSNFKVTTFNLFSADTALMTNNNCKSFRGQTKLIGG